MFSSEASFFGKMKFKFFKRRMSYEIHDRVLEHLRQENNFGYPFQTKEELIALTDQLDARNLLETIEEQIAHMPDHYGKAFRYILHRDLRQRLEMYEKIARKAVYRETIDSRLVTT